MQELDNMEFSIGTGVIVETDEDRFAGYLLGIDDMGISIKVSHRMQVAPVIVDGSAQSFFRNKVQMMSGARLRLVVTLTGAKVWKLTREEMEEICYWVLVRKYAESQPEQKELTEIAKYVLTFVPLMSLVKMESIADIQAGNVLVDLDFPATMGSETAGGQTDEDKSDEDDEGRNQNGE